MVVDNAALQQLPVLRDYAPGDREQLLAHFSTTWAATYPTDFFTTQMANVATSLDPVTWLCGDNGRLIVAVADAEPDGEIVGTVGFRSVEQVSYVIAMYVRPNWQRRGLGKGLLTAALRRLPIDRNVVVNAMASSTWALVFYEKYGFKRFEQRDLDVGSGIVVPSIGLFLHRSELTQLIPA